ncbi:MAG TPA: AI-2E family transporter [Xanthomonadales bacterium]|nr:AI-2E family transporter [Xanthomonadales bacterium]
MKENEVGSAVPAEPVPAQPVQLLATPVDLRSGSLMLIAVLGSLAALYFARNLVVPLVLGILLSYVLAPLVDHLVKLRLPRALAALLLLVGIIGGTGFTAYALSDDTVTLIEALPGMAQKLRRGFDAQSTRGPTAAIERVQKAASEIERSAENANSSLEPERDVAKVQIQKPKVDVKDYLLPGTLGVVEATGMVAVVFLIAFFLLAAGDNFRRKMIKLAGPTLSEKKLTLQALDEIDSQIQRYMLVQVFTSSLVGLATWLVFSWIGVDYAAVWGVVAFVANFIPYLGSMLTSGAAMLAGFVQFGTFEMALLIGAASLAINSLEGYVLTPWLTSRSTRMNPVAVFSGVLAWGWLWGVWGLFLAVPIMVVIKVVCDRVDEFKTVGELLGE